MPSPRYQEIAAELRNKIESGVYGPGAQLPTEKELAEEYDAARNTIRDAVAALKIQRLLETRPGRGTFVVERPSIFQITLTPDMETGFSGGEGAAWLAEAKTQGRNATVSKPRVEIRTDDLVKAEVLRVEHGESLVSRHQERFINDIPWSLQTSYYPLSFVDEGAVRLLRNVDIEPGSTAYLEEVLGRKQTSYRDTLSVRPPAENEVRFFDLPVNGSVQIVEHRRTAFDAAGEPLRHTVTVYPADRNEFVIEATLPTAADLEAHASQEHGGT